MAKLFSAQERIRQLLSTTLAVLCLFSSLCRGGERERVLLCWGNFSVLSRTISTDPWSHRATATGRYHTARRILDRQREQLSPEEFQRFQDWYYDHFFSDRWESFQDNAQSERRHLHHSNRYDVDGEQPFTGYLAAHAVLDSMPLSRLRIDDLNQAHLALMSRYSLPGSGGILGWFRTRNSESTPSAALGRLRGTQVGFNSRAEHNSRYRVPSTGETLSGSPTDITNIHEVNPYLRFTPPRKEGGYGWVDYMPLSRWRNFSPILSTDLKEKLLAAEAEQKAVAPPDIETELAKVRAEHVKEFREELFREWDRINTRWERGRLTREERDAALEEAGSIISDELEDLMERERLYMEGKSRRLDRSRASLEPLREQFIREVLEERWSHLLNDLKGAKTQQDIIELVGDFYYDFVSIHPYRNGNGRMGRLLAERLLSHHNLPPPLWTYLGEDVLLSRGDFLKLFRDALAVSRQFHSDLDRMTAAAVPHDGVSIGFLVGRLDPATAQKYTVDADEFMAWIAAGSRDAFADMSEALKAFQAWRASQDYDTSNGRGIRLATPIFVGTFGRLSSNRTAFDKKLERFYSPLGKVSRALTLDYRPTDEELLGHFSGEAVGLRPAGANHPASAFAAFNATLVRTPKQIRRWPDGWFGAASSFQDARVVTTYWGDHPVPERLGNSSVATLEVTARRREIATFDNGRSTDVLGAVARDNEKRLVFHPGGIDPESVTQVVVRDTGTSRRRVAERTTWNEVRVREYNGTHLVTDQTYRLSPDGRWRLR